MKFIYVNPDYIDESIVLPDGKFVWPMVFTREELALLDLIYNHEMLYSFLGVQLKSYHITYYS